MRMPFGKYKDCPLETLEINYLTWVRDNLAKISPALRHAIDSEIRRRQLSVVQPDDHAPDHAEGKTSR
jgi:hypothetical protein